MNGSVAITSWKLCHCGTAGRMTGGTSVDSLSVLIEVKIIQRNGPTNKQAPSTSTRWISSEEAAMGRLALVVEAAMECLVLVVACIILSLLDVMHPAFLQLELNGGD